MICSILEHGAKADGALQTAAIQAALDACFLAGGGRVVVPAGKFLTGGLRLRSHTELYLQRGAVLKGSMDPEDYMAHLSDAIEPLREPAEGDKHPFLYPVGRWNNAIIRVIDGEDIAITGEPGSVIDGGNCYDPLGEENYRGPHAINIQRSENIRLEGYTVKDAGDWSHAVFYSKGITAKNIRVLGGHDGFDFRACDDILVEDCEICTGDDCLAGFDINDMTVRNCACRSACSIMRLGGNHILVENCTGGTATEYRFRGSLTKEEKAASAPTHDGCRSAMHTVFRYFCDFRHDPRRTPGDIVIRNCRFDGPDDMFQLSFDGKQKWCCNRSLSSIRFEDCCVTGVKKPIHIHGDEKEPLTFAMKNVTVSVRKGFENAAVLEAVNYAAITLENVEFPGYADPRAVLRTEGEWKVFGGTALRLAEA